LITYGPATSAVLLSTKQFVLDWFIPCRVSDGFPIVVTPAIITFWVLTFVAIIMRIIDVYHQSLSQKRDYSVPQWIVNLRLALQSISTAGGFVFFPTVSYSFAYIGTNRYVTFVSLICAILLLISQPISTGRIDRTCLSGAIASIFAVIMPSILSLIVGLGTSRSVILGLSFLTSILLSVTDIIVLWVSFFGKANFHQSRWHHSLGLTITIRIVSSLSGLVFLVFLHKNLTRGASFVAFAFWCIWICLPWISIVPLTMAIPAVLSRRPDGKIGRANARVGIDDPYLIGRVRSVDSFGNLISEEGTPMQEKGMIRTSINRGEDIDSSSVIFADSDDEMD